jgi:hypothetical protein
MTTSGGLQAAIFAILCPDWSLLVLPFDMLLAHVHRSVRHLSLTLSGCHLGQTLARLIRWRPKRPKKHRPNNDSHYAASISSQSSQPDTSRGPGRNQLYNVSKLLLRGTLEGFHFFLPLLDNFKGRKLATVAR